MSFSLQTFWKNLPGSKKAIVFVMSAIFLIHGCDAFVVRPASMRHWESVVSLTPSQVQSIEITRRKPQDTVFPPRTHTLSPTEVSAILPLLSQAKEYSPSHPNIQWEYKVQILGGSDGGKGPITLVLFDSANNGTYIQLGSWYQGTFRNDALKPFVERLFGVQPEQ